MRRRRSRPSRRCARIFTSVRSPSTAVPRRFAMTGWRIGFAGGPEWIIKAMSKLQSQSTSTLLDRSGGRRGGTDRSGVSGRAQCRVQRSAATWW